MTNTARILSNGFGGFYVNIGAMRLRQDFKTVAGAIRAAQKKGYTVDTSDLPNPKAVSCASGVAVIARHNDMTQTVCQIVFEQGAILTGTTAQLNPVLKDMGYKPIRVTRNMLNPDAGQFVIDADTPSYCDPGCESYHTM